MVLDHSIPRRFAWKLSRLVSLLSNYFVCFLSLALLLRLGTLYPDVAPGLDT
jgi:hypothetical protein